ncbi:unnamed protein product [Echinostoma caproni]|uniref:SERPIN domain-containing protein n=1 Tax=Echinostoma caproni TaxID=27848 RepID=A0A183AT06_9TREM|nr:unnamed protein product [Echinostoma caproni]
MKNQFVSPLGIYTALSAILVGSAGETKTELLKVLHLKKLETNGKLHEAIGRTLSKLTSSTALELLMSTGLFVRNDFDLNDTYEKHIGELYGALARRVDFRGKPDDQRKHINAWVCEKTKGKITELISPGTIYEETCLVLVNALYFKGKWYKCFDDRYTHPGDFFTLDGGSTTVQMMSQTEEFEWADLTDLDSVSLWMKFEGRVILPRFKLNTNDAWEPEKTLISLGASSLFDKKRPNLPGIRASHSLTFENFMHEAKLEVNEVGAEAVAATAFCASDSMGIHFKVDHPFMVLLIDENNIPVFAGHVTKPG